MVNCWGENSVYYFYYLSITFFVCECPLFDIECSWPITKVSDCKLTTQIIFFVPSKYILSPLSTEINVYVSYFDFVTSATSVWLRLTCTFCFSGQNLYTRATYFQMEQSFVYDIHTIYINKIKFPVEATFAESHTVTCYFQEL